MNKRKIISNIALLTAALVWGFAFVSQEQAAKYVDSFTVNALRSLVATVALLPLILFRAKKSSVPVLEKNKKDRRLMFTSGIMCGTLLCISSNLQQFGISLYPDDAAISARSGFITALYVVLVPICGAIFKRKVSFTVWISVVVATIGLYLLCGSSGLSGIYLGDLVVLCCALSFSFQILCVDHFIDRVDSVKLSAIQFLTCGILSLVLMFIFERPSIESIILSARYILYLGVVSSAVGYTLQIIGQKYSDNPTVASILMSLESVFAALGGWLLLNKSLSFVEILGCIVMFAAIVLAQLPIKSNKKA
ncbi:MAG: DMT family transporter [Ruminococcaceae bacterium]|nr:DMT family transporter [Oscillospiraceae bacterium]